MDSEVAEQEQIANFILESNKFRPDGSVHPNAFRPSKDGERSVMRVDGLSREYVAATGQAFVGNYRDKKILGWGQLRVGDVRSSNVLRVEADRPPPRHALILGWPPKRDKQDALTLFLASLTQPHRWP
jgi:hypothetical protein